MPKDMIEEMLGATIQHGMLSKRIYLMKIGEACAEEMVPALAKLAKAKGYGKIFAKVPAGKTEVFLSAGYHVEARVEHFFEGREDAVFLGFYPDETRQKEVDRERLEEIIEVAKEKHSMGITSKELPGDIVLRQCTEGQTSEMAKVYEKVFPSYPFPINDPEYLRKTMETHIVYFGAEVKGRLIALSSAEMDEKEKNVEMTDFATLPEHRGSGLAAHLLSKMEEAMRKRGILTAYTIARAVSLGINITFARLGYTYGGRLVNNTNISGKIESMNVWYKPL